MKRSLYLMFLVGLCACQNHGFQSKPELWKSLEPGPNQVGFRIESVYDSTRTFSYLEEGSKDSIEKFRPMQLSIWYPAERSDRERMKMEDYYQYAMIEEVFRPVVEEDKEAIYSEVKQFIAELEVSQTVDSTLRSFFRSMSMARLDATPLSGRFPLIIYSTGADPGGTAGSSFENTMLFEYLASHGYIVASVPSYVGRKVSGSGWFPIETQAIDLEFILNYMRNHDHVDIAKVGTMGFSWGGMGQLIMSARNPEVKAFVSLDGGVSISTFKKFLEPYEDDIIPQEIDFPVLFMLSSPLWRDQWPTPSGDSIRFNENYFENILTPKALLKFKHLAHRDFASDQLIQLALSSRDSAKIHNMIELPLIRHRLEHDGYLKVCEYARYFFDSQLKSNQAQSDLISQDHESEHLFLELC